MILVFQGKVSRMAWRIQINKIINVQSSSCSFVLSIVWFTVARIIINSLFHSWTIIYIYLVRTMSFISFMPRSIHLTCLCFIYHQFIYSEAYLFIYYIPSSSHTWIKLVVLLLKLKLRRCTEQHQDLIDDFQSELEDLQEFSYVLDLPQPVYGNNPLKHIGVTRMNLSARRFSAC